MNNKIVQRTLLVFFTVAWWGFVGREIYETPEEVERAVAAAWMDIGSPTPDLLMEDVDVQVP